MPVTSLAGALDNDTGPSRNRTSQAGGTLACVRPGPLHVGALICPWREDLLVCHKCGGRRKVTAIIANPKKARETLEELGIHVEPLRLTKARGPPIQQDLPSARDWDGIDPVYPD